MYITGAHIVSTYANMSYTAFVSSRIFKPAKMNSTTFSVDEAMLTGKFSHLWSSSGRRIPFVDYPADVLAGPGGVISNTEDLVKLLYFIRANGEG